MNGVIDFLTKLGNVPIVTISLGAFLGSFATYIFTVKQKKIHDEQVTKQVLSFINIEIHENFANRINSNYPYNELSLKGFELISIQAGNININNDQLTKINRIYTLFDVINKNILTVREAKNNGRPTADLANKLKELQNRCIVFAGEYVKETYSE
ncbi:hypothetical protein ES702_00343 [subsurface metagenome]